LIEDDDNFWRDPSPEAQAARVPLGLGGDRPFHVNLAPPAYERLPVDSRAVPCLVRYAERPEGSFHRFYRVNWPHLPMWMANRLPRPIDIDQRRYIAMDLLGRLGADASPAIPTLIRIAREDRLPAMRRAAAISLQRFAGEDQRVQAALSEAK